MFLASCKKMFNFAATLFTYSASYRIVEINAIKHQKKLNNLKSNFYSIKKMIISSIVACAKNNVIGFNNQIPWYLPADLKYFQRLTSGHHIVMGRKCFESIGRPLPKRTNIIVSKNHFYLVNGCAVVFSIEEALTMAQSNGETEVFIIGGGEIYRQTIDLCDKIYLTEVNVTVEGTVFFPELNAEEWQLTHEESHKADAKNEFDYIFKIFERKI